MMKTTHQVAKTILAGFVASLALTTPLHAKTMGTASKMGAGGMMQMHDKMQADMKMMDSELDALVIKMNQADSSNKMDAMAAVITKMVQQRETMERKMATMQASMMQGMMGKMDGGMKMTTPMTLKTHGK